MTDRHDEGFAVSPQPLGGPAAGGPRRRRRLASAAIIATATVILVLGVVGPRLQGRPSFDVSFFATATPGTSETPADSGQLYAPGATPLPFVSRAADAAVQGSVALLGDSFRVL